MNTDTIKQQLTIARGAYKMGSLDAATLDKALDIIEKEVGASVLKADAPKPAAAPAPTKPLFESFKSPPAAPEHPA